MKVLILFGGESSEHEVSVVSAGNIYKAINKKKHQVSLAFISRDGRFYIVDKVKKYNNTNRLKEIYPILGQNRFESKDGKTVVAPDVFFPVMHGENSEDGAILALAKLLHIPVVGCDMYASALCMDKLATKRVLEYVGIKTAPWIAHRIGDGVDFDKVTAKLGMPVFVKPTKTGSSVGISKVKSEAKLATALKLAHKYGDLALIESAIPDAREIEVAMLGGKKQVRASVAGEIVPDREFYDYESKYSDDSTSQAIIPADLPKETAKQIHDSAIKAWRALGCNGLARIDFLLGNDGQLILNEVNTLPGFTNISMYPKLWEYMGLSQTELIEELLKRAK